MQFKPNSNISHIVRHYLVLKGELPVESTLRLFADGNTGLVFNAGNCSLRVPGSAPAQHRSWLYGQLTRYQDFSVSGPLNWIVVVFQPYGAFHLWGVPATEWKDRFFPAQELLGHSLDAISDAILKAPTVADIVALLDAWILRQSEGRKQPDTLLLQAIQQINSGEGKLPVQSLLKQLQVNERMLERKFKLATGITPKQYSGIVRMNATAKKLQGLQVTGKLTTVAYDSDYFDQAHFIKDFRKFTGITPWQYQHTVDPLALNFLRL